MTGQISRLEWWISVTLVVLVIVVHALLPRYEYQLAGGRRSWLGARGPVDGSGDLRHAGQHGRDS